ncbi:hypothetical protein [Actinokineospora globicatena]|uniref:hypothetical protein n=1 Tax=Actinokineospora globicatena TaxID=103729 RepID=UPI0020A5A3E8|nr:hypothetical protein [Actinokineospora globicatena]MCP2305326.1 hypothetical protein [Actinokineospora globicatena]GLW80803.1 hypothetical protein Aglo01_52840 [Actinokineospora globicatena]GLW87630.1 hypothetical protein Aglo02_52690 [Actinokineospora globicatena]
MRTNHPTPEVILLAESGPNRLRRLRAAFRNAHPDAVVTGREALWLNGIPVPQQGAVHLLVPLKRPGRADGSVIVERTAHPPEPLWRRGFPTTPAARAAVDSCRRAATLDQVRELIDVTRAGGVEVSDLHAELAHVPEQGTTLLRRVLAEIDRDLRWRSAKAAQDLVDRAGLPPPTWTARLSTVGDVHLAVVDAWWDKVAFAWDCDLHRPWAPRTGVPALTRAARLTAAGIVPLHTDPLRVIAEPDTVVEELRGAYRLATTRPRPEVIMS